MSQGRLWYETPEDALQSLVDALGGYKRVAADLWPALPAAEAGRRLADCLNPARAHKLELREVLWLLKRGREAGCHVAIAYINETCGYAEPEPVNPEDEHAKLQREFISAVAHLQTIQKRMDANGLRRVA